MGSPRSDRAGPAGGGARPRREAGRRSACAEIDRLIEAERRAGRLVKVGFNHRFHPGIARAAAEVHSGVHGELLHLRGRYGHGGRLGYDREWRAEPARSGGGELIDQGMHLLDLSHWLAGPLPLHSAILRTQFWDTRRRGQRRSAARRGRGRAPAPGRCCTSAGRSGRTCSRSRSTAAPQRSRSTGSCAPTDRSDCRSTACVPSSGLRMSRSSSTPTRTAPGRRSGSTLPMPSTADDGRPLLGDLGGRALCVDAGRGRLRGRSLREHARGRDHRAVGIGCSTDAGRASEPSRSRRGGRTLASRVCDRRLPGGRRATR